MMSKQHCFFLCLLTPKLGSLVLILLFRACSNACNICQVILVDVVLVYAALVCLMEIYLEKNFEKVCYLVMVQVGQAFVLLNNLTLSHVQAFVLWTPF
ncbi:hypothetical protein VNO80_02649 [Phaseolus coccineus]|uniref:Uncharacterized protein n=1 Tax=Phaseolus coccineus TaxID=3886 RepID=A0AAN9NUK1_PHACN